MKKISTLLLFLFLGFNCLSQSLIDVQLTTNTPANTCISQAGAQIQLNTSLSDSYGIKVSFKNQNDSTFREVTLLPSEFSSDGGVLTYNLPVDSSLGSASFVKVSATILQMIIVGPGLPIPVPLDFDTDERYRCLNDFDNDGILNSSDSCPLDVNTGNDLDQDGIDDACDDSDDRDRNLTITGLRVFVGNTEYNVFNNAQPLINENEEVRFVVTVSNNGNFEASSSELDILFSADSDAYPVPNSNQVVSLGTGNAGVIQGNSSATDEIIEFFSDFVGGIQLFENTQYYVFAHVDYDNEVDETDESNFDNIVVFPVTYNDTQGIGGGGPRPIGPIDTSRISSPEKPKLLSTKSKFVNKLYEVKIYSFDGNLVGKRTVSNESEERIFITEMKKGIYIVETAIKTYKITKL